MEHHVVNMKNGILYEITQAFKVHFFGLMVPFGLFFGSVNFMQGPKNQYECQATLIKLYWFPKVISF